MRDTGPIQLGAKAVSNVRAVVQQSLTEMVCYDRSTDHVIVGLEPPINRDRSSHSCKSTKATAKLCCGSISLVSFSSR